jgi:hypothetical protein
MAVDQVEGLVGVNPVEVRVLFPAHYQQRTWGDGALSPFSVLTVVNAKRGQKGGSVGFALGLNLSVYGHLRRNMNPKESDAWLGSNSNRLAIFTLSFGCGTRS